MIGFKIKKIREERNKSREDAADYMEMGLRTYTKIETNQRDLTLEETKKLATFLEVTPEDLEYNEPRIVFEKCNNNNSVLNNGVVNVQLPEELKELLQQKDKIIAQQNIIIEQQNQLIAQLSR